MIFSLEKAQDAGPSPSRADLCYPASLLTMDSRSLRMIILVWALLVAAAVASPVSQVKRTIDLDDDSIVVGK